MPKNLLGAGIGVTFWRATEVENYLLLPNAIARVSGAAPEVIDLRIAEACEDMLESTQASYLAAHLQFSLGIEPTTALRAARDAFEAAWAQLPQRRLLVRGSEVLFRLNAWLENEGYQTVSAYSLAKTMKPQQLDPEVFAIMMELEDRLV